MSSIVAAKRAPPFAETLVLCLPSGLLSWFEKFAAFQAMAFGARGDESTKWAHAIAGGLVVAWLHSGQFLQQRRQERKHAAETGKE